MSIMVATGRRCKIMHTDDRIRTIVRDTVEETLRGLGLSPQDPKEMQADLIYLHRMRKGTEDMAIMIRRSIITMTIPSVLYFLWQAFRNMVR